MMITYKIKNGINDEPLCILSSDGWVIPFDPDNTDYQEYLTWVAQGNTPLPADEL